MTTTAKTEQDQARFKDEYQKLVQEIRAANRQREERGLIPPLYTKRSTWQSPARIEEDVQGTLLNLTIKWCDTHRTTTIPIPTLYRLMQQQWYDYTKGQPRPAKKLPVDVFLYLLSHAVLMRFYDLVPTEDSEAPTTIPPSSPFGPVPLYGTFKDPEALAIINDDGTTDWYSALKCRVPEPGQTEALNEMQPSVNEMPEPERQLYCQALDIIHQRVEAACRAAGHSQTYLRYAAYEVQSNLPIDNLDETTVKGAVRLIRNYDEYWDQTRQGHAYQSPILESPTWLQVAVYANEAIAATGDRTHSYLEELEEAEKQPESGVRHYELWMGS
jgi:hypothetical protein